MNLSSNWLRGGTAPKIAKSGVRNGALTSAQRIRNIEREKIARERRANAAEIMGEVRREIAANRELHNKVKATRIATDIAATQSLVEFPNAKMKIVRDKAGNTVIQRRNNGKFIAPIKVAAN